MLEKLKLVEEKYLELCARAEQPDFYADPKRAAAYLKEQKELEPVVTAFRAYRRARQDMLDASELMAGQADAELKALCQEEYAAAKKRSEELEQELKILLLPHDPNDDKSVIMEIRGGVGGEESALFAHSLFRMYSLYAASKGWTIELLNYSETELGGIKEADFVVNGAGAYSRLKFESGVHRVQRVPETESQGRVHTSTVTVAVLPEAADVEVEILDKDLKIDTFRSGGAGGQHVNKTESAIRITHLPTGMVVICEDERSQIKNREKAMKVLKTRLYDYYQQIADKEITDKRKAQIGTGDRSERIRTYNYPQGRVTDHRIGFTLYSLTNFLNGDMDEMIEALQIAAMNKALESNAEGIL